MAANLAVPLRDALIGNSGIVTLLSSYHGSYPVFTRRPAPADAPRPLIMVSPDVALTDQDGINDLRPIQQRDITVYGMNDIPTKYNVVEDLGYLIRDLFHSERLSITVPNWHVIQITARGPIPAPTDDDKMVARMVMLTIELARKL